VLLAVVDEDVGDALAGGLLDVPVGVAKGHAELSCDLPADGRLAGAGRTDEHEQRAHRMLSAFR
jgi:hypothetical protein